MGDEALDQREGLLDEAVFCFIGERERDGDDDKQG
jgi:hypothetical protein